MPRRSPGWLAALLLAVVHIGIAGCEMLPEVSFELAEQSRAPRWLKIPDNAKRSDVKIMMHYVSRSNRRNAVFELFAEGKKIQSVDTMLRGMHPIDGNSLGLGDVRFEVATVDGQSEVIEHRIRGPIFSISDDPAVWKAVDFAPNLQNR